MIHVNLHKGYIAASSVYRTLPHLLSKWVSKLSFYLGCAKSQNLARLREIAKNNTRKIIGIPKSQNFVLANNSNIKVFVISRNQPASSDDMMLTRRWLRSSSRSSSWVAVQSRCFEPWPDVTGNFRNFLVLVGFLSSRRQVSIVDCSNGVFSSINRLRWTVKIMSSLLSNFWSRTFRTKAQLPWLSTRTTLFMCSWLLVTSSSNREEERPPEPITGFGSRAGTTNCDASGLGGFVRQYLSTRNLRITSNFFRCTMYLVSRSVLCHCLVKQH